MRFSFLKTDFTKGVAVLAGGTVAGQIIYLITMPIITRLYTPEDFGILSVYLSVLMVLATAPSLRYELAIPLTKIDSIAQYIVLLGFSIIFILFIIIITFLIIFTFFFEKELIDFFQIDKTLMFYLLWLLPLGFIAVGLYGLLSYWTIRKKEYRLIAKTKFSQSVSAVITNITLGYLQYGALGLIGGSIVGQIAGTLSLFLCFKQGISKQKTLCCKKIKGFFAVLIRYRKFPLISVPAGILNNIGNFAPPLLLAKIYGLEIAGYFLLANKVLGAPLQLVGSSVGEVYYAEASKILRTKQSDIKELFISVAKKLFFFSLMLSLILILTGKLFFILIFGENWEIAGDYLSILVLMFFARFITAPLAVTFSILEKQHLSLLIQIIIMVCSIGSLLLAKAFDFNHINAIMSYSLCMFFAYACIFFIIFRILGKKAIT
jgi:O-antigen/teichoic acid export membrane protein